MGIAVLSGGGRPAPRDPVVELSLKLDQLRKPFLKNDPVFQSLRENLRYDHLAAPGEERTPMQRLAIEMGYMLFTLSQQMRLLQNKIDTQRRNSADDMAALKDLRGQLRAVTNYYKETLGVYNAYELGEVEVGITVPAGMEPDRKYTGTGMDMGSDSEMFKQVHFIATYISNPWAGSVNGLKDPLLDLIDQTGEVLNENPRLAGALRAFTGITEIPAGAATGNPVVFFIAAANGMDNWANGFTTVITGEVLPTLTASLFTEGASKLGFSDSTAATIGSVGDAAVPIVIIGIGGLKSSGTAAAGPKQFYSYFYAPQREGAMLSSTGRVYMTTAAPGAWVTNSTAKAAFLRFIRTGHVRPFDGQFTTGLVNPSEFGLTRIGPTTTNFWKFFGEQYHTRIGISGFETAGPGSSLLVPSAVPSSAFQRIQSLVGLAGERSADAAVVYIIFVNGSSTNN